MTIKINAIQPSFLILNQNKQVNVQKPTKGKDKNFNEVLQNILKNKEEE